MRGFSTIDVNELYEIGGGEIYDMSETILGVAGKISDWFKGLFE